MRKSYNRKTKKYIFSVGGAEFESDTAHVPANILNKFSDNGWNLLSIITNTTVSYGEGSTSYEYLFVKNERDR